MVFGICGYGNSGASAIVDYLRGYSNIKMFNKFEFQLLHEVDGINDLKYYLTGNRERIACNTAIHRFIKLQEKGSFASGMRSILGERYDEWWKSYINSLIQASWDGEDSLYDGTELQRGRLYRKLYYRQLIMRAKSSGSPYRIQLTTLRKRFFSMMTEEEFDSITKKYISELFGLLNLSLSDKVMVDMLFSSTDTSRGMEFFDDAKAIIVNREPRDVYVSSKVHPEDSRFMPNGSVKEFISYYKNMQRFIKSSPNTLVVQYEDLIYKYRETAEAIRAFLGIESLPDREFRFFNPTVSVKYTHRTSVYEQYAADVKKIEEQLPEYLYDYDSVKSPLLDEELVKQANSVGYRGLNEK
jgi:hypothetical protein